MTAHPCRCKSCGDPVQTMNESPVAGFCSVCASQHGLTLQPCSGQHQRATLAEAIELGFVKWDANQVKGAPDCNGDWVPDLDRCVKCGESMATLNAPMAAGKNFSNRGSGFTA